MRLKLNWYWGYVTHVTVREDYVNLNAKPIYCSCTEHVTMYRLIVCLQGSKR